MKPPNTSDRVQVWSSGGGVQSAAIAALIVRGDLPRPDFAVIADTGYEASTTWEYMDEVIQPALNAVGVSLVRVKSSDFSNVGLYSKNGDILIPAFTTESGEVGKLPTYCSNEWKQRVIQRWLRTQTDAKKFHIWIGISIDEMRRAKPTIGKYEKRYVLIEQLKNRGDCIALVRSMGWRDAPRSSCWKCPNRSPQEWEYLKQTAPQDFLKAVKFEKQMQEKDECLWLTRSAQPLDVLADSGELFTGLCDSGFCFT